MDGRLIILLDLESVLIEQGRSLLADASQVAA
jgi:hypothetical protein